MPERPRSERVTQDRLAAHITTPEDKGGLGYRNLGDWSGRPNNRCVEPDLLRANLSARGYSDNEINAALTRLMQAIEVTGTTLYQANLRTYTLLRYGVDVQTSVATPHKTVHLIDWDNPAANDFALAEEVTLKGGHERRPDLVIYLNGLAVAVIELKRSSVEIGDGIRQLISNQNEIFNAPFFATAQLLLAGSDAQGLRYGTVGTPETLFVEWRDEEPPTGDLVAGALLDRPVAQMLRKDRLLDLIRNFVIFDAGIKKVPRATPVRRREAGAGAAGQARGRRHLAHPGVRQEHPDGAAGQMDPRTRAGCTRADHHRPRRTRQADRGRDAQCGRGRGRCAIAPGDAPR